ncbi:MAG: hypothetical protein HQ555_11655 [Candidatus Aminicenantes bacterium]|nr:hypothetical protein [Candidatus Aminicenantes bacterium]
MRLGRITDVYPLIEKKLEEHYKEHGRQEIGIQVTRRTCMANINGPIEKPKQSEGKIKDIVNAFSRLAECERFDIIIKSRYLQENIIEIIYMDVTGFDVNISS